VTTQHGDLDPFCRQPVIHGTVFGNSKSLQEYDHEVVRIIFKWLNRRSQRRGKNWTGFKGLLKHFQLPKPRIVERLFARKAAGSV